MGKLTIEQKAQRYDEAIKVAKDIRNGKATYIPDGTPVIEAIFPELKESEDKRMLKQLRDFFKNHIDSVYEEIDDNNDVLAWLEKQGNPTDINPSEFDLRLNKLLKQFETMPKEELANSLSFYLNVVQNDGTYKPDEKQSEQKPADKVEPKFKVGDWITDGEKVWKIGYIEDDMYIEHRGTISAGGAIKSIDKHYHLWTIQDAKDGDVLAVENRPFIYNGKVNPLSVGGYCGITTNGLLKIYEERPGYEHKGWTMLDGDIHPATKEQRDLLFQKMKESGYEWDADKKELKKIVTPKFNVHDCIIKKHNSNINDFGSFIITNITGGKYWYNDRIICDISEQDEWELYEPVRQNTTEWSEEDETRLTNIIIMLKEGASRHFIKDNITKAVDWLKSLKDRVQPQQEWSEKDNQYLCGLIGLIEQSKAELPITLKGKAADNCIDWLKSLKDRYTWKPSYEQMKALGIAIHWGIQLGTWEETALKDLIKQLKKLREE